jgi:alginate O-acetyltransferase complex protein AlgJ
MRLSDSMADVTTSPPETRASVRSGRRGPTAVRTGMLFRYRRWFAALSFLMLATPLVWGVVLPDNPEYVFKEGRRLAPPPQLDATPAGWFALPGQVDAYLKDHFGLRYAMIRLHKDLTHPVLLKVNTGALIGRDGRMFYEGNEMVRQSAGLVLRDQRIADAVDLVAAMRDALARKGAGFIVAVPPNSSTIYQDDLPFWAQNKGKKTEYDLFLEGLAARGVKTVDLRPVMQAVRAQGEAYLMYDAHWTRRAALAGFNAVVEADRHPDWRLDPATSLGPPELRRGGDVARILGVQDDVSEEMETFALSQSGTDEALSKEIMPDHVITTGRPGPTVMVIGDSFTQSYFPLMLAQHVGRAIWIHHHECGFDWKLIDRLKPEEVWWAPTERFLVCDPGARPIGFAG